MDKGDIAFDEARELASDEAFESAVAALAKDIVLGKVSLRLARLAIRGFDYERSKIQT